MNIKEIKIISSSAILIFILLPFMVTAQTSLIEEELKYYSEDLPFEMNSIAVPNFPDKDFNIVNYGAVGDGLTLNTVAFTEAVKACNENGGGRVVVPKGIWLTGPIELMDNVNLHLEQGAHIQFSKDFDLYPLVLTSYEGRPQYRCTSPLNGRNLNNIAVTGNGVIDGNGDAWRFVKRFKLTENQWKELTKKGAVDPKGRSWWPSEQALNAEQYIEDLGKNISELTLEEARNIKDYLRPVMVSLVECKNILLDGVTFQNSPAWNLHPLKCENLIVRNITVRNPWYSQNGDGIDIESCKNVYVYKARFDVGDDAICIKSGRDKYGRDRGMPTEKVVIEDCIVYHGHGGFTIGSEMSGGVKDVKVSNCNFIGTDVGVRFKSTRGRGGIVENIFISDIYMKDIPTNAISFNMYYGGKAPTEAASPEDESKTATTVAVTEETPIFRKIYLDNIICTGAQDAVILQGLPEMPISELELNNLTMTAVNGVSIYDADGIKISDARIVTAEEPVYKIIQGKNIVLEKIDYSANQKLMRIGGYKSGEIKIINTHINSVREDIELGDGVNKDSFKIVE